MYLLIKSTYIKNKIKGLTWRKHTYIDHLIRLESFILQKPNSFTGNIYFAALQSKYRKEFEEILKELIPAEYRQYLKGQQKMKDEQIKTAKTNKKIEDKLKQEWQQAGGKIEP